MQSAIVLLSGGLDSATVLAMARAREFECYALSVDYGQRHRVELVAAARVAESLGAKDHRLMVAYQLLEGEIDVQARLDNRLLRKFHGSE